jgi:hypothetical protein
MNLPCSTPNSDKLRVYDGTTAFTNQTPAHTNGQQHGISTFVAARTCGVAAATSTVSAHVACSSRHGRRPNS